MAEKRPIILFTKYTPYMVADLESLIDHGGRELETEPVMALCRCGGSKRKPYCDGSHAKMGFVGDKASDRIKDKARTYGGREITIVDNRGVCSHDKACVRSLPSVFDDTRKRWINPDGASRDEIIETIKKCPSGALSYKIENIRYQDLDRPPLIHIEKDGPLRVEGSVILKDDRCSTPESGEHYTLCRCGHSRNKPFCDGTHHSIEFMDPLD
jgi:CDGSH-type Zn-finger protein